MRLGRAAARTGGGCNQVRRGGELRGDVYSGTIDDCRAVVRRQVDECRRFSAEVEEQAKPRPGNSQPLRSRPSSPRPGFIGSINWLNFPHDCTTLSSKKKSDFNNLVQIDVKTLKGATSVRG